MNLFQRRRELTAQADIVLQARMFRISGLILVPLCVAAALYVWVGPHRNVSLRSIIVWGGFFTYQAVLWSFLITRAWPIAHLDPAHVPAGTKFMPRWSASLFLVPVLLAALLA